MLGVADSVIDCIRPRVPQPTEWQHIGNQIDAAFVVARADFAFMDAMAQRLVGAIS
jgi:hypothetical protein